MAGLGCLRSSPEARGHDAAWLLTHTGLPAWYPFYADGRGFFDILAGLPRRRNGIQRHRLYAAARGDMLSHRARLKAIEGISQPPGIKELCSTRRSLPLVPPAGTTQSRKICARAGDELRPLPSSPHDVIGERTTGTRFIISTASAVTPGFSGRLGRSGAGYFTCTPVPSISARDAAARLSGRCLVFHTGGAFPPAAATPALPEPACGWTGSGIGLVLLTNRLYSTIFRGGHEPFARVHEALRAQPDKKVGIV